MGCTPSKSTGVYTHGKVYRDLDTCSTFVPSHKSSVSTPERPVLCVEDSSGKQTLCVPCRDVLGRSVSQSYCDSRSSVDNTVLHQNTAPRHSPTQDSHSSPDGCGTP